MNNIFLTGFMGCGKTSVGRVLADRLGWDFIDLDQVIVDEAGTSIKEIFSSRGEPAFRAMETKALKRVAGRTSQVVSTGGGVVIAVENRRAMRAAGSIVNLTASVDAIAARVTGDSERPLLAADASVERIRNMLESREEFYADADLRIDTTAKSIQAVADEVLDSMKGFL